MIPSASSCLCGGVGGGSVDQDEYLKDALIDEATDLPVCDYDENPTPLYKAMEAHQWGAVARFLKSGVWPGSFFSDAQTPKQQVKTWIHRYNNDTHQEVVDDDGVHDVATKATTSTYHFKGVEERARLNRLRRSNKRVLRWRQLPLHAALIFLAPPSIVKQLVELFPYALRCPDDKGMLPLHLAFRQAVPDDILTVLLRLFPNGMHVRDQKGRLPVECVRMDLMDSATTTGPPALRGMIIQSIMQQSKEKFSQEQQQTVNKFQTDVQSLQSKMQQLEQHLQQVNHREEQTRHELTSTLEELQELKKNHRKLQEMQRSSMQRQSEHEALERQQQEFQQRIMEQLHLEARDDRNYYNNHRRSSHHHHNRHRPPVRPPSQSQTPPTPPSLPRQDSQSRYNSSGERDDAGRAPTPSSNSQPVFNKYHHTGGAGAAAGSPGPMGDETEDQSISYSSGGQSHYSAGMAPTTFTAPTAYTATSHHNHHRHKNNHSPGIFNQNTSRDSFTTKFTRDTGTAYTGGYYYSEVEEDDDMDNNRHRSSHRSGYKKKSGHQPYGGGGGVAHALHPHATSGGGGGGGGAGVLGRRPKANAKAIHPIETTSNGNMMANMMANVGKNNGKNTASSFEVEDPQKVNGVCSSPQSPFDNWDFTGIFKPLAIKDL